MNKRVCTTALAVLMALAAAGSVLAAEITPFWVNMFSCDAKVIFSSTTATCRVDIAGKPGTTYIEADIELQEKEPGGSYEVIARWPNRTASGSTLDWSYSFPGRTPGNTYQLVVDATVTTNGSTVTETAYSSEVVCP